MKIHIVGLLTLSLTGQNCLAAAMQPVDSIEKTINDFALANLNTTDTYQLSKAIVDPRLQLPLCDQTLQAFVQSGEIKAGRNTLGIRCSGSKTWTTYSVVILKIYKPVLVLNKPLRRNEVIRADYLDSETRDTSLLLPGYISDPNQVINKQATRNISAGSVLNQQHITELALIKRGERVTIQSGSAGFQISAIGTAMMDGSKGQVISVKNLSSQKIVQGTVTNLGQISVIF